MFAAGPLLEAYHRATDDVSVPSKPSSCVERFSTLSVVHVAGEPQNFKITYPHDVHLANELARRRHP